MGKFDFGDSYLRCVVYVLGCDYAKCVWYKAELLFLSKEETDYGEFRRR